MAHAARKDFDQNLIWAWIGKLDFVDDQRFLRFDEYCSFTFGAHYSRGVVSKERCGKIFSILRNSAEHFRDTILSLILASSVKWLNRGQTARAVRQSAPTNRAPSGDVLR